MARLCNQEATGLPDMPSLSMRQDRIGRAGERVHFQIEQAWQTAEILDVLCRQDRSHPRQAAGAASIDGEFRMRMRRAQDQRVHRSLRRVVIGVAALAANQRIVFLAKDALTNAKFDGSHRISDYSWKSCAILQWIARKRKRL